MLIFSVVSAACAGAPCTSVNCRSTAFTQPIPNTTEKDTIRSIQCTLRCMQTVILSRMLDVLKKKLCSTLCFMKCLLYSLHQNLYLLGEVWTNERGTNLKSYNTCTLVHACTIACTYTQRMRACVRHPCVRARARVHCAKGISIGRIAGVYVHFYTFFLYITCNIFHVALRLYQRLAAVLFTTR